MKGDRAGLFSFFKVSRFRFWVGLIILFPVLLVFAAFQTNFYSAYVIISGSMLPTLQIGDCVIVRTDTGDIPRRGTIFAFHNPLQPDEVLVKRVIGIPGDEIVVRQGYLYINNKMENAEHASPLLMKRSEFIARVGEEEVFVLGDNRNNSFDSLDFGMVNRQYFVGSVFFVYWPPSHIRFIKRDYDIFSDSPELE